MSLLKPAVHGLTSPWRRLSLAVAALLFVALATATLVMPVQAQTPPASSPPAPKADPAGTAVGSPEDLSGVTVGGASVSADDIAKAKTNEPFAYNLAGYVNQNRLAVNLVWTLVTGYLVMFMQAGFAMVETGFCRAKSAMQVMMTNFMIYGIGMLAFWVCGFAFMEGGVGLVGLPTLGGLGFLDKEVSIKLWGTAWGLFGYKGFFLGPDVLDVGVATLFLFQMVFMDTAATILTGAVAERWRWVSFMLWGVFVGGFMYPIFANWAWGGGWLSQLGATHNLGKGYLDFAGSGVVHAQGGWAALAGATELGARLGKFNRDGSPNPMPGHNLNMAAVGCFILAFGWFGFNPGSTLGASGNGNLRIGEIATVTMLAGAAGSVSAMFYGWSVLRKWDPGYMMNGLLAGLVAITAPSGWVSPISAVIIGLVAGILVCVAMGFFERVLHIDDPVGAISVHGVNGAWGVLALGLFADGTANYGGLQAKGLFFGDGGQFLAQLIGAVTVFVWCFGTSYVFFSILKRLGIFRSRPEDELAGLDLPEMGTSAYPLDPGIPPEVATPIPGGGWQPTPVLGRT
ncbi:MAG: ammonium transporter [Dehalococcoidia bacterium]